jgi:RecB family endonuclease NucS
MKTHLKPYLLLAIGLISLYSCQDEVTDEDLLQAQREKAELEARNQTKRDSLDFILSLKELDYQRYVDSLKRADSVSYINGFQLPYTYNVQVYDGTNTI